MIKVCNLTKRFGRKTALDNLSFEVEQGEIVGFLGPNGAGKTTTMRILSGFLSATGGDITIAGMDLFEHPVEIRQKIGYLPENAPVYLEMRVKEYLYYRARLKGLKGKKLHSRIDEVVSHCFLGNVYKRIIGQLSKGYIKRICLADSLVHEPDILILDEPTIGLDPNQMRHIRNLIKSFAQNHTVLLSSHILPEIETICERVLIIKNGKIVASDTPGNLVGLIKGDIQVVAEIRGDENEITSKIESIEGVISVSCEPCGDWNRLICECENGIDIRTNLFRITTRNNWVLRELSINKGKLEDVFIEMTGDN